MLIAVSPSVVMAQAHLRLPMVAVFPMISDSSQTLITRLARRPSPVLVQRGAVHRSLPLHNSDTARRRSKREAPFPRTLASSARSSARMDRLPSRALDHLLPPVGILLLGSKGLLI